MASALSARNWNGLMFVAGLVLALIGESGAASDRVENKPGTDRVPQASPTVSGLVAQLGSPKFGERKAALQKLRELGAKALPAVAAGQKHADLEIARRCQELVLVLRADWLKKFQEDLQADEAGRKEHDHPIWQRFKKVAGEDLASRNLLSEMLQDGRRGRLLDAVEVAPEKAGVLYQQEVERLAENTRKGVDAGMPRGKFALDSSDPTPQPVEVATGFYLGTFPATARIFAPPGVQGEVHGLRPVEESMGLFHNPFQDGLKGRFGPPLKRLFVAWLAQRANPESIYNGLENALTGKIAEALPVARKIATNGKLHIKCRAATLPILGMYGEAADERLMSAFLADTGVYTEYEHERRKTVTQVRDLALGSLVAMRGRNPGDFGFPSFMNQDFGPNTYVYFYPHELGFFDNATRDAAHRRAKEWLASQPRPKLKEDSPR